MKGTGYRKTGKIFWGIFLIFTAAFLVVGRLGFLQGVGVVSILFALFWAAIMIQGIIERSFGKILFPLACICIIFDEPLGITAITPWTVLLAAALGTVGLNLIFKRKKHYYKWNWQEDNMEAEIYEEAEEKYVDLDGNFTEEANRAQNGLNGNKIFFRTSFGEAVKFVNADHFEFAALECSFGAMKVFFDNALIPDGAATIELDVSFGGMELYVPKEWNIIVHTVNTFGGIEEKNHCRTNGSPAVTLTGNVSFSGVTIVYI